MPLSDFGLPKWVKVGATVDQKGTLRVIEKIEVVPSTDSYWASLGQEELKITFAEGAGHTYGLSTLRQYKG